MSMFSGFIVAIVIFFLVLAASRRFGEKKRVGMAEAVCFGLLAGTVCAFSPKVPAWLAMFFLFSVLLMMFAIVMWWSNNGSTIRELLNIALIDLLLMLVGSSAAARILDLSSAKVVVGVIRVLPGVALLLSLGYFISDMLAFKEWLKSDDFDENEYLQGDEEISDFNIRHESLRKKMRRWLDEA